MILHIEVLSKHLLNTCCVLGIALCARKPRGRESAPALREMERTTMWKRCEAVLGTRDTANRARRQEVGKGLRRSHLIGNMNNRKKTVKTSQGLARRWVSCIDISAAGITGAEWARVEGLRSDHESCVSHNKQGTGIVSLVTEVPGGFSQGNDMVRGSSRNKEDALPESP